MGRASVRCAGKCKCRGAEDLDAHAPAQHVSVTAIHSATLGITARGGPPTPRGNSSRGRTDCCELTVRVLPRREPPPPAEGGAAAGTKFKLTSLIQAPSYRVFAEARRASARTRHTYVDS